MKNYGITFLAFGEEHINEFNTTVQNLLKLDASLDIFVVTDNQSLIENKNIHIREINEIFNYNLKRKSFEFAFEHHSIVVFMDTDVIINKHIDLDYIESVEEGMEVRWKSDRTDYMGKEITVNEISQTEYGKAINDNNLEFINEFIMILRIDKVSERKKFVDYWDHLNQKTYDYQPHNGQKGALEGLIIYSACNKIGLGVRKIRNDFFKNIYNVGTLNQYRKTKVNKTIL